jgi:hypothetical protein
MKLKKNQLKRHKKPLDSTIQTRDSGNDTEIIS